MKQIVPFIKNIEFKTNIEEVTCISLDYTLKSTLDNIISGEFDLYLEYKENDISVIAEKYESKIPFDIDLDEKYSLDKVKVEIDDFYYEIEDNIIILHIDLLVNDLELVEEKLDDVIVKHEERLELSEIEKTDEEELKEELEEREDIEITDLFKEDEVVIPVEVKEKPKNTKNIFETFDPANETYVTYNVHIVREDDNVDSICLKYAVSKEDLANYNDLKEIKMGDKLIVPTYKK